jgi:hypothetical protein
LERLFNEILIDERVAAAVAAVICIATLIAVSD